MEIQLEPSIILHCQPYRETSLFVDLLGLHTGRIRVVAKGVRRGKSPLAYVLRPFNRVVASWKGRGDLPNLIFCESQCDPVGLTGTALYSAFYLSELLVYLLPRQDPVPELFEFLWDTLVALPKTIQVEPLLRYFELSLLETLGYGVELDQDASGQPIEPSQPYQYRFEEGFVRADGESPGAVLGSTLQALYLRNLQEASKVKEARILMRHLIQYHLKGRELKSRALFRPISREKQ